MWRGLHVAQQGVHFFNAQRRPARTAVWQPACRKALQDVLSRPAPAPVHQFPRPYLSKDPHIAFIHKGGHFAHHDGGWASCSGPKRSITNPVRPVRRARHQPLGGVRLHFDNFRHQQNLALNPIFGDLPLHALINKTLMRRMLVDVTNPSWVCANMYVSCNCARARPSGKLASAWCLIVHSGSGCAQPIDGVFGKAAIIGWCTANRPVRRRRPGPCWPCPMIPPGETGRYNVWSATVVAARCPASASAARSAPTIMPRTSALSRKRLRFLPDAH